MGIPFASAYTLQTSGLLEAILLDVRTGTFLFTVQVYVDAKARRQQVRETAPADLTT